MDIESSSIGAGVSALVFAVALFYSRRAHNRAQRSRIPWMPILFLSLLGFLLFARHFMTILTGR